MDKIVLASNNKHKIAEFRQILKDSEIVTMEDIGFKGEIIENGSTFFQNAMIKANTIMEFLKKKKIEASVIADDSGLCVDSLGGEPGVFSARYSGIHGDDKANRQKLLEKLENKKDRKAHFVCSIVELYPDGHYIQAQGETSGQIMYENKGGNGFGYDPLFYSDELKKSFGEATSEEKNSVSHRAKAIEKLKILRAK